MSRSAGPNAGEDRAPLVTIGLPVYNGEAHLAESIESILAQTMGDLELVIADNASTDGTIAICERYAASDPRVRIERSAENLGAAWNYNRLVDAARGRYFKWSSHDDVCGPRLLERCVAVMEEDPGVELCYPKTMLIDGTGAELGLYSDRMHLDARSATARVAAAASRLRLCNAVFGVMRTETLRGTRLIQAYPASDKVLLTELAMRGRFFEVDEALFLRRMHGGMSRQANRSARDVAQWFNPKAAMSGHLAARLRELRGHWRAVWESPRPFATRLASCCAFFATHACRRARVRAGRLARRLRGRPTGPAWERSVSAGEA